MQLFATLLIAAAVFGLCYLLDKGFTKLFRSQSQHLSGRSVRLGKNCAVIGLLMLALGVGALCSGIQDGSSLFICGGILITVVGLGLALYYLFTGIFYDDDSFVYTAFLRKNRTYRYDQIRFQQLYMVQGGSVVIELHMTDGSAVQVQSNMAGYDKFLDTAFLGWVQQRNIDIRSGADFHDPDNSKWFPSEEEI